MLTKIILPCSPYLQSYKEHNRHSFMCRTDLFQPSCRSVMIICSQSIHMDLWLIFILSNRMRKKKKQAFMRADIPSL